MKVYVITKTWTTPDDDGHELVAAYSVWDEAVDMLREFAHENKRRLTKIYGDVWVSDYSQDDETYISFGFYGHACEPDTIYTWELIPMEVQ